MAKKVPFHCVIWCGFLFLSAAIVQSQPLTMNTLAGYAGRGSSDGSGSNARFNHPHGLAADNAGNLYVADTDNHTIRKITPSGVVITVAGLAGVSGSDDNAGSSARFFQPQGVAVDNGGNIYVADTGNHTIRHITPEGAVSTYAGFPGVSGNEGGYWSDARFNQPRGIAVDNSGIVYVADYGNSAIRKITPDGVVSTFTYSVGPQGLAVDNTGNIYAADYARSVVLQITSAGSASTLAGSITNYGSIDATGTNALFYYPAAVAGNTAGNVYVADYFNNTIRRVTAAGVVSTFAGSAGNYGSADGTGTNALFYGPQGVAVDSAGNVFVADTGNSTIRKISPAGLVITFAGSSSAGSADGRRGNARFHWPAGMTTDNAGNLYIADAQNNIIRKMTPSGVATTLAGSAGNYGSVDSTGVNAQFYRPQGVAVDGAGNVFVVDTANSTIRKITPAGIVSTLAGSVGNYGSVDGTGNNAEFYQPQGIALDNAGNVIVADTLNHTIRKISFGGVVTTIAGMGENHGSADGTDRNARFNWPAGVAVDGSGNIFVADSFNHAIRKITPVGTNWVTDTIAGITGLWGKADGTNSNARFFLPRGIVTDNAGDLYVLDSGNHTIRKITPVGTNWIVSTIAGLTGVSGIADGTGNNAQFNYPAGIAIDSVGYLYVADSANNTIRINRIVPPFLHSSFASSQIVLSWSVLASGFVLETASALPSPLWVPVNGVAISGDSYAVTNNASAGTAFYRLRKP